MLFSLTELLIYLNKGRGYFKWNKLYYESWYSYMD